MRENHWHLHTERVGPLVWGRAIYQVDHYHQRYWTGVLDCHAFTPAGAKRRLKRMIRRQERRWERRGILA